uniref:Uncharacterized protein n=1 Tax=Anguilla anguilla TaxID=7936 RepID=A0A0E9TE79_ANGAN
MSDILYIINLGHKNFILLHINVIQP